jgi:hypothetical protein
MGASWGINKTMAQVQALFRRGNRTWHRWRGPCGWKIVKLHRTGAVRMMGNDGAGIDGCARTVPGVRVAFAEGWGTGGVQSAVCGPAKGGGSVCPSSWGMGGSRLEGIGELVPRKHDVSG